MATHEYDVSFTLVECDVCRNEHAAGLGCGSCGAPPLSDPHVSARRAILREALQALNEEVRQGHALEVDLGAFGRMSAWLGDFMDECSRAALGEESAGPRLAMLTRELIGWSADVAASPRLRPFLWYWEALGDHHRQLHRVAEHYLAALSTADPETAEREGEAAQQAIDAAAAASEEMNWRLDRWEKLDAATEHDHPTAVLQGLVAATAHERGPLSLLDADQHADALFEKVTGQPHCPPALRFGLRATVVQTDMIVAEERLWRVARLTHRRLVGRHAGGRAAFASVIAASPWREDIIAVQAEMFEAGIELRQAIGIDRHRTQARALVRFGHILAERCAPRLIATILAAYKGREYTDLRERDFSDLLSQAEDVRLDTLLLGLDRALRHGDAHGRLFEITSDGVRFFADRREYDFLSFPGLLDRALGGFESVTAILMGVLCAIESEGFSTDLDPFGSLDLSTDDIARLVLTMAGWEVREVVLDGRQLRVRASAEEACARFSVIIMLAPYITGDESICVTLEVSGSMRTWEGPANTLVSYINRPEGLPDELPVLEVLAGWTQDERPMVSAEQLRKVLAVVALRAIAERSTHVERSHVVEAVRAVADHARDRALSSLLRDIEGQLSRLAAGRGDRTQWARAIDRLTRMASREVPIVSL